MNPSYSRSDFGPDFHWGISTAAYQVEGSHNLDGKGSSIWDEFVHKKRKIFGGHHANTSCDFYNRYRSDIQLMNSLNIPNYRFSISWSRIMPLGTGSINQKGIDFYNRLIDYMLQLGIEPWITLYHWDLPQALQEKGGWTNRDVIGWFSDYTHECGKHFGDRVKNWIVLNEPMVFTGAGYFLGMHAPGKKGIRNFLPAVHHAAICQAQGGRILKEMNDKYHVGTTFSCTHIEPWKYTTRNMEAAKRTDALVNRLFIEPLLGMGYPTHDLPILKRLEPYIRQDDEKKLVFDMDFIGLQNYTREVVAHSFLMPYIGARIIKPDKRNVPATLMNWEVYPQAMYEILKKFGRYEKIKEIIITENGAAFPDEVMNGTVNDLHRLKYLDENIYQVLKAQREGVNVKGYFVWTLTDNFEWAEGYRTPFGLVHVDFKTQERIVKSSGYWYRNFLGNKE